MSYTYLTSTSRNENYEDKDEDPEGLKPFLEKAVPLAKEAGELMLRYARGCGSYEQEEHEANIANIDADVEEIIIRGLQKIYPDHNFIGKNAFTQNKDSCVLKDDPTWIVDPLGGTLNFSHGFQHSGISIGMMSNKEPVLGIIYNPMLEQLITAVRGGGAIYNDQPIHVSPVRELKHALVSFDCDATGDEKRDEVIFETFENMVPLVHGVRNLGSTALNMAMVAMGGCDACFGFDVRVWEICAGAIIVLEAGGVVLEPTLSPLDIFSKEVLCTSTPELAEELSQRLMLFDSLRRSSDIELPSSPQTKGDVSSLITQKLTKFLEDSATDVQDVPQSSGKKQKETDIEDLSKDLKKI